MATVLYGVKQGKQVSLCTFSTCFQWQRHKKDSSGIVYRTEIRAQPFVLPLSVGSVLCGARVRFGRVPDFPGTSLCSFPLTPRAGVCLRVNIALQPHLLGRPWNNALWVSVSSHQHQFVLVGPCVFFFFLLSISLNSGYLTFGFQALVSDRKDEVYRDYRLKSCDTPSSYNQIPAMFAHPVLLFLQ